MATVEEKVAASSKGVRGPSYPAINIKQAIERAQQLWNMEKRNAAPLGAVAKHWNYSETSSSGRITTAALLQYGLLEDEGSKDNRTVKLSGRALDVLLDEPDSPKRLKAIQDAVLAPRITAEILSKWPAHELPSDQTLRFYLLREKGFNDGAVDGFIKDLRDSISYARLDEVAKMPEEQKKEAPKNPDRSLEQVPIEVDDIVQWESDGVLRMEAPRRVRAKQAHEGSWWIFVEGSETGIPMEEAVVVERAAPEPKRERAAPTLALSPAQEDRPVVVSPSEREWLRGPLSKEVNYRLIVAGELGSKEIGKLIKLLEAQKLVLDDDE